MTKQQGQLQAWDRAHGWHNVLEAPPEVTKKCSECGRVMANDECGDEFPEERVCDECAGITPEAVKETYMVKLAEGLPVTTSSWADVLQFIKYWDVESVDVLQNDEVIYRISVTEV